MPAKVRNVCMALCVLVGGMSFLLFSSFVPHAQAAGIVPCGQNSSGSEGSPCTICHFMVGFKNLIDWGLQIMTFFAVAVIVAMGILYIVSAGDQKMTTMAKDGLKAVLYGFALMLLAYLIVLVLLVTLTNSLGNPDFVSANFKIDSRGITFNCSTQSKSGTSTMVIGGTGGNTGVSTGGSSTGGGSCSVVNDASNACSVQSMAGTCFSGRAQDASKICNFESGGKVDSASGTDHCSDGASFSHGIWQINLVTSGSLLPAACQGVFTGNMDCIEHTTNSKGVSYCSKRNCRVAKPDQQAACLSAIRDPKTNTAVACKLYQSAGNFQPWPHTRTTCGIN